ncbi:MAG: hypothetical protein H2043_11700 [Rhizobiales bacterium]|nr:hypothetical protein [Hyphomicrobiales bacterium]
MGAGHHGASWGEMAEGVLNKDDETSVERESDQHKSAVSLETQWDWMRLLAFTLIMAIPFALVAWLMS